MGKILPKRKFFKSAIYTPNLDVGSHIDNVKHSLDHLIFSNTKEVEDAILKKRVKIVAFVTLLLMLVGSFISPKGQAEVAVFYPTACLGGWNSPRNAEGEPETGGTYDDTRYSDLNSAVLPLATNADIYCGNFVGTIEQNTKPTKMIVSLAWVQKSEGRAAESLQAMSLATSTESAASTIVATSTTSLTASTTDATASSTEELESASSTTDISTSSVPIVATTTASTTSEIAVPSTENNESSALDKVVDAVQDILGSLFGKGDSSVETSTTTGTNSETQTSKTESAPETSSSTTNQVQVEPVITVPVPVEVTPETPSVVPESVQIAPPTEVIPETSPTSFFETLLNKITSHFVNTVFAEEVISAADEIVATTTMSESDIVTEIATTSAQSVQLSSSTPTETSSTTISVASSSTENSTTTTTVIPENVSNDFLEVLYTFDGVTWNSLGRVDENSMKYRTFEIPVTASTSWEDMGQLQIKVQVVERVDATPLVYLDGIKVEVLYETPVTHEHPDFKRDTILYDEVIRGVRILRIINNDTNKEEIWYMYAETSSTTATTTESVETSSSTELLVASTMEVTLPATDTQETVSTSSTTPKDVVVATPLVASTSSSTSTILSVGREVKTTLVKNTWVKLESSEVAAKGTETLLKEIEKQEKRKEYMPPDFTKDVIKKIGGSSLNAVLVQIEQGGIDTLWIFDVENDTYEKIDQEGKATFSKKYPFGIKDNTVFWLSDDELILFRYDIDTKVLDYKEIAPYDDSTGGRGEVTFEGSVWKIIIGGGQLSFYSELTGEVFSDDNLAVGEAFRVKHGLDVVLGQDKIEELNFVVEIEEE